MLPFVDQGLDFLDSIATFVRQLVSSDDMRSRVELVKFSGKDADVIRDDTTKVYLRCTSERMRDGAGEPVEFIARLVSVAGIWNIPAEACELVAVVPEDAARAVGAAYVFPMSATPPTKLALGVKAFWSIAGKLLVAANAIVMKTPGLTFGMDGGKLTIAFANGTRLEADSSGFKFVVVDTVGVANAFVIDGAGVHCVLVPNGVPMLQWQLDALTGGIYSLGLGPFLAAHPTGFLGVTPSKPILPTATWYAGP